MKQSRKTMFAKIALLFLSIILSFTLCEIIWRIILFSNIDIDIFTKQRKPELYAVEYTDDDYWKLHLYLNKKSYLSIFDKLIKSNKYSDPPLINQYIDVNFNHINDEHMKNRRPVLLYGDSFANYSSPNDDSFGFEHILNSDNAFSKNNYLLNYGASGYGLDSIYLLLKNSIDNYSNPFVVLSFMTLDLDRSSLSYFQAPKSFFTIENNFLKLNEKPAYSTAESLISDNKPQIISYFYRRVIFSKLAMKLMPDTLISFLKREAYFREKTKEINNKIMLEIIKELRARNLNFVFLIFHPNWISGYGTLNENTTDWRDTFIKQEFPQFFSSFPRRRESSLSYSPHALEENSIS